MRRLFHYHGLSIVMLTLFVVTLVGLIVFGRIEYNDEQQTHGLPEVSLVEYLGTSHLWQAVAENWESEFLQMAAFIYLGAHLFQKGSPESKDPDKDEHPQDEDPQIKSHDPNAPWPVRKGGFVLRVYEHSLSLTFLVIFLISFALHAVAGKMAHNHEQMQQGQPPVTLLEFIGSGRFWFESMQNWQSEFLSIAAMIILAIFLRERGSPESKPVATPHWENE